MREMVDEKSKLAVTLLPVTKTLGQCYKSMIPAFLVEGLQPALLFTLAMSRKLWNGIVTRRITLARHVKGIKNTSRGIAEEVAQRLYTANALFDRSQLRPDILPG